MIVLVVFRDFLSFAKSAAAFFEESFGKNHAFYANVTSISSVFGTGRPLILFGY